MMNPNEKPSPLFGDVHDNDVLCGRGGSVNSHPGNERFRQLVEKRKRVYLTARFKREKRLIASSIVSEIRALEPPGQFLSKNSITGKWEDIGDEKARDKTSQALRENAPSIRAEIETEIHEQRRVEMAQDEAVVSSVVPAPAGPPPLYYAQWGYYGGFYGGWGPPQDLSGHPQGAYSGQHPGQWPQGPYGQATSPENNMPPPAIRPETTLSSHRHSSAKSPVRPPAVQSSRSEDSRGSALDSIPNFVNAVPSSIASWTKNSFSFADPQDDNLSTTSSKRVTFRSEQSPQRGSTKRQRSSATPADIGYPSESSADPGSLLSQVANHILGSWDTSGIACSADPESAVDDRAMVKAEPAEITMEEVGQEVELVDDLRMDYDAMDADDDIREETTDIQSPAEIDWTTRVGSCHTWLPEAPSFFSMGGQNPLSPSASLEMDQSATGVSLGGASLAQLFKDDGLAGPSASHDPMASPRHSMNQRVLNQIPSWERSFRSHSPSTVASDSSFLSKRSETRLMSPRTLSPRNSMEWDQPKLRE